MSSDPDTDMGGPCGRFPVTRLTAIAALSSSSGPERARGYESVFEVYWKPSYKYLRIKWHKSNEDAKDTTQEFFALALQKRWFDVYEPAKGSFRHFLRTLLDRFVSNQLKSEGRIKRGGELNRHVSFENAEEELLMQPDVESLSMEEFFHREWVRSLFGAAIETLQQQCQSEGKLHQFRIFEMYDLAALSTEQAPSYSTVASDLGLRVTDVTNYLAAARRRFRAIVLDALREMTATDEEFTAEAEAILGSTRQ